MPPHGLAFCPSRDPIMKGAEPIRLRLELDLDVADEAPNDDNITLHDEQHFVTHLRLLGVLDDETWLSADT